jgi:hypothetical protein
VPDAFAVGEGNDTGAGGGHGDIVALRGRKGEYIKNRHSTCVVGMSDTSAERIAESISPSTTPHSLQESSASLPLTLTTMQPQQSTPAELWGLIGKSAIAI